MKYRKALQFSVTISIVLCISLTLVTEAFGVVLIAPTRTLRLGDTGSDVLLLQKMLNTSSETVVSLSGMGSPGYESTYFGNKTFTAVKKFQALYSNEILVPLGLVSPTGNVGPSTLKKLTEIAGASMQPPLHSSLIPSIQVQTLTTPATQPTSTQLQYQPVQASAIMPVPLTPNMQLAPGQNPNTVNLEYALASIEAAAKKQGMNATQLEELKNAIRMNASSTTDFSAQFFNSIKTASGTPPLLPTSLVPKPKNIVARLLSLFRIVHTAEAATGLAFGGAIYFTTPCTCSYNTALLIIQPLPPSYASVLAYTYGSQLYLSYNLPYSTHLLGFYLPGGQSCWMWAGKVCVAAPTQGIITPRVGSAPI